MKFPNQKMLKKKFNFKLNTAVLSEGFSVCSTQPYIVRFS